MRTGLRRSCHNETKLFNSTDTSKEAHVYCILYCNVVQRNVNPELGEKLRLKSDNQSVKSN